MKRRSVHLIGAVALAVGAVAGLLIVTLPASASSPRSDTAAERVPIRWFVGLGAGTDPSQVAVQQQVVADFNASQTTISLTLEVVGNSAAYETLRTQIAQGNAPDIVGQMGIFASNSFYGQWLDLSPIITATGYDLSDFDPELVNLYCEAGQGLTGLPLDVYPSYIYYNEDLFAQAGLAYPPHQYGQPYTDTVHGGAWTIDKLEEIAKLLTLDNNSRNATNPAFDVGHIVQFGYLTQWNGARGEATLFGTHSFVDANGDAQIPANWRTAFQWYYDGMWGSQPFIPNTPYELSDHFGNSNSFNSGHIAMAHCHPWYLSQLGSNVHWDIAAVPAYSATVTAQIDSNSFRILRASDHPTEAFQAMTYLIGTAALTLTNYYHGFPARTSLQTSALHSLKLAHPGVDWQVMVDSIHYLDNPNHEGYMPNFQKAEDRLQQFRDLYHGTAGLNINVELDRLRSDLQWIFHERLVYLPLVMRNHK